MKRSQRRSVDKLRGRSRRCIAARRRGLFLEPLEARRLLATFVVNSALDFADVAPGDGVAIDLLGGTSLRAAIMEANALPGPDIIEVPAGIYSITRAGRNEDAALSGDLDITENLVIIGADARTTVIDGRQQDRVFEIFAGVDVTLRNLTIEGGDAVASSGGGIFNAGSLTITDSVIRDNQSDASGGAIRNVGQLTIERSRFQENRAQAGAGGAIHSDNELLIHDSSFVDNEALVGGAIQKTGSLTVEGALFSGNRGANSGGAIASPDGMTVIIDSTFAGNRSDGRGAALVDDSSSLNVINSTFTDNVITGVGVADGGALFVSSGETHIINTTISSNAANETDVGSTATGGGLVVDLTALVFLINSTITNNHAAVAGGGIHLAQNLGNHGVLNIVNTIVAGNSAAAAADVSGEVISNGGNFVGDATGSVGFNQPTDQTGSTAAPIDPLLGPLEDNGGPTPTHALSPLSPAIGAAVLNFAPAFDQRGAPRPLGVGADIGAFELDPDGGSIRGVVWNDANGDGHRQVAEALVGGRTVYLDLDNNGTRDFGEPTSTTNAQGEYFFGAVAPGRYVVRLEPLAGVRQSFPDPQGSDAESVLIPVVDHRDLIFDPLRQLLYITTAAGEVQRFDAASKSLLAPLAVGTELFGADITPDSSALYVADSEPGIIRKVDLATGTVSNLTYTPQSGESLGSFDVAIGPAGKGFVTTNFAGSGWVPLRELNLATDTLTIRNDAPGSGANNTVRQSSRVWRGADRSHFLFTEPNSSAGPAFWYETVGDSFTLTTRTNASLSDAYAAVSRGGLLMGLEIGGGIGFTDKDFASGDAFSGFQGGMAFDPVRDLFYAVDADKDQIAAYDLFTGSEVFRIDIGEDVGPSTAFDDGEVELSSDGAYLFLSTPLGVRMFDLPVSGHVVKIDADDAARGVDFGVFAEVTPQISINDVEVNEGDSGATRVQFEVSLSQPSAARVSVDFVTIDGSATRTDNDYQLAITSLGTLHFRPGETVKTITAQIIGDTRDEFDEQFSVVLSQPVNAVIAKFRGDARIINDDSGARGAINGVKWHDLNGDGERDAGEPILAGWTIYIDQNNNGRLDPGEPAATTDSNGEYSLANLPAGVHTVAEAPRERWRQTAPVGVAGIGPQQVVIPIADRRDHLHDPSRGLLYVTTQSGLIQRFSLDEQRLHEPIDAGAWLSGFDITPAGDALYVAESQRGVNAGYMRKVNLADGSVVTIPYGLADREIGAWDVAIADNGKGFLTTAFDGSGWVPFREFALAADRLQIRPVALGSGPGGTIRQVTHLNRSADRSRLLLQEANISSGPLLLYASAQDSFPLQANSGFSQSYGRVNRDGTLVATLDLRDVVVRDATFAEVHRFGDVQGGFVFDPMRDVIYVVDHEERELAAYDTVNFTLLGRTPLPLAATSSPLGAGEMSASSDGRRLFYSVDGGILMIPVIVDAHQVTLTAGAIVGNIDFGNQNINKLPVAADDSYNVDEDATLNVAAPGVLGNDSDGDGDTLTAVKLTDPANGSLVLNANGSFSYTPSANFHGTDSFTYLADDGFDPIAATVTITVNAVNDAPVAADDSYSVDEDLTLAIAAAGLLANDNDIDSSAITASIVTLPANGSATVNADGSFSYTPSANFNGVDTFTYRASDGALDSNVATVTITVNAVNDAPVAADDSYSVDEDLTLAIAAAGLLANDNDVDSSAITASIVTLPANGSATVNANGSFTYTPSANFNGVDTFTYKANDGALDSNVATVTITVHAVNDTPVANDDSHSVDEDNTITIAAPGVLGNDTDVDGDVLTASIVSLPAHGGLTMQPNGSFSYTPSANFNGVDTFTYKANDGALDSNVATVTITVNAVNDVPVAVDDSYTIDEDQTLTIAAPGLLANDSDADGTSLSAALVDSPANGAVSVAANGSFVYTPAAHFNGVDSFTYRASDGAADSNLATVVVNVTSINDAPVAVGAQLGATENTPFAGQLAASDVDTPAAALTFSVTSGPTNGVLNLAADGSFTYTPANGFRGQDSFSFVANDGQLDSNVAAVLIDVAPGNELPVIDAIASNSESCGSVMQGHSIELSASFSDGDLADTHTASVDWGDGFVTPGAVNEAGGVGAATASHRYTHGGIYSATLRVVGNRGEVSSAQTIVYVAGIGLHDGVLQIVGSDDRDGIAVFPTGGGRIGAAALFLPYIDRMHDFDAAQVDRIHIVLCGGNDLGSVSPNVTAPVTIDGGGGRDTLLAGGGDAALVGGSQNDILVGGLGRNVLIGGSGADRLSGGLDDDLLIGGATVFDNTADSGNDAALLAVLNEWRSPNTYESRLANLRTGAGPLLSPLSVSLVKTPPQKTVFDDGVVDQLTGDDGRDWFFSDLVDELVDLSGNEQVD